MSSQLVLRTGLSLQSDGQRQSLRHGRVDGILTEEAESRPTHAAKVPVSVQKTATLFADLCIARSRSHTPEGELTCTMFREGGVFAWNGLRPLCAPDGTELISGGLSLVVIEDKSDNWVQGIASFRNELGSQAIETGAGERVTAKRMNATILTLPSRLKLYPVEPS